MLVYVASRRNVKPAPAFKRDKMVLRASRDCQPSLHYPSIRIIWYSCLPFRRVPYECKRINIEGSVI